MERAEGSSDCGIVMPNRFSNHSRVSKAAHQLLRLYVLQLFVATNEINVSSLLHLSVAVISTAIELVLQPLSSLDLNRRLSTTWSRCWHFDPNFAFLGLLRFDTKYLFPGGRI